MPTQKLLFISDDGITLFATDGDIVHQLASTTSTLAFLFDPLQYNPPSAVVVGSKAYFTMADSIGATSAI